MAKKVVIALGSTGGHFFPGLRIAQHLREKYGIEAVLLGPIKEKFHTILKREGLPFINLQIPSRGQQVSATVLFYWALLVSSFRAFFYLLKIRPQLVMGTGSFGSLPSCVAAFLLHKPLFIHEQNIIPGKVNHWLGKYADKIFLAFPNSPFSSSKTLVVGNPVKTEKLDLDRVTCYKKFDLDSGKKTLLIFGGSQGSSDINDCFRGLLGELEHFPDWQILHITGKRDYQTVKERYRRYSIGSCALPFCYPMEYAYRIADLAICRAGALSLSELSIWGIPAMVIPYPYSKDNHQESNALYFQQRGGAYLVRGEEVKNGIFLKKLKRLLLDSEEREAMGSRMREILPDDASRRICEEIKKYVR